MDLLQPSLTPEDNLGVFRNPWNPYGIMFVAFFGGILPAVVLATVNYYRLGMRHRRLLRAGTGFLGATGVALGGMGLVAFLWPETAADQFLVFAAVNRGVALIATWWIINPQRRRFALYEVEHEGGGMFGYAVIAILALGFAQGWLLTKFARAIGYYAA